MKYTINFLVTGLLLFVVMTAYGQQPKPFREKSDPEATKILRKLKKMYSKYNGLELKYSLVVEYGEDKEVYEGQVLQQDDKYFVNNNGNLIINNGKSVWYYVTSSNEVQINDYDPDEGESDIFSPSKILNMGDNDEDYFYAITGEDSRGYKIEFKPRDSDSEIMKMRIRVNKEQTKISSIKVFQDDGTRMTFTVKSIKSIELSKDDFTFLPAKYPGVVVTDLRE